jgi:hypothetical protein
MQEQQLGNEKFTRAAIWQWLLAPSSSTALRLRPNALKQIMGLVLLHSAIF